MESLEQGTKHDDGKNRIELFPAEALFGISAVLTFGAKKYADRNWEKGIKYGRVFGGLMRHLWAWWAGQDLDPETQLSHLWHAGCCLCFLLTYEARRMTQFDDRPGHLMVTHEQPTINVDGWDVVSTMEPGPNMQRYDK